MIFKAYKWENISDESQLYKKQVNGLNDPCLKDYNPLLFSAFCKKEYKKDEMTKEFIKSFIEAAKSLSKAVKEEQSTNKIFYIYSLTLPALYLCRHSIEMVIKYSLDLLHKDYRKMHKLKALWNELFKAISSNLQNDKERSIINNMGLFVDYLNNLDDNGQRLRYAIQSSGDMSQEDFLWVNLQNIVDSSERFIDQILSIDF